MLLAYYNPKDNTFHEKWYSYEERENCKKDYNTLKQARVPFYYTNGGMGFYAVDEHGLSHGKLVDISDLPIRVATKFEEHIKEDDSREYGGKRELMWNCYESEYWYSLKVDLGEDNFENEVINEYFVTKDLKSELCR